MKHLLRRTTVVASIAAVLGLALLMWLFLPPPPIPTWLIHVLTPVVALFLPASSPDADPFMNFLAYLAYASAAVGLTAALTHRLRSGRWD